LTGIAANKTIPVNDIMFYRVTAGLRGKQRQCPQSERFLAHSHNCLHHNYIEITAGTLSTRTGLTSTKIVVMLVKVKGKVHPITGHEGPEVEYRYSSTLPLTSALDGGGWSTPRPGCFIPGEDLVPIA
jgi:hypothetical protein